MEEQEKKASKKMKVDIEKLMTVIRENGFSILEQAGYYKVTAAKGRQLYVAKTQEVGRVDISGFEMPATVGVKDLRGERFGGVKQQLDFDGTYDEAAILVTFRAVCEHMKSLPPAEKVKKKFEVKQPTPAVATPSSQLPPEVQGDAALLLPVAKLNPEQRAKRLQLIKDEHQRQVTDGRFYRKRTITAHENGISPATLVELGGGA